MNKDEITETENLEKRISEMKSQFQQSYDVFIRAHEELSKINFESLNLSSTAESLNHFEPGDMNEIIDAGSIDDCISMLRSKVKIDGEGQQEILPEPVHKLLNIMNGLQSDIESLAENQKQFSKLSADVNNEMSLFEKRMQDSVTQLDELVVESLDGSESSHHDKECFEIEEEEESFGSEYFSDQFQ